MMTIYEHRGTITASGGTTTTTTLNIHGGLLKQVLIRAATSSTVFSASLADDHSVTRRSYDFHTGEINDMDVSLPVQDAYTLTITNASSNDTFTVILAVQE